MISELHAWFAAETHCFTGTLNDMATEAELISADEEFLQSRLNELVGTNPGLSRVLFIETNGNETTLKHRNGSRWFSFFRKTG